MATPLSYPKFLAALKAEGLKVVEHKTDGKSPQYHNRNSKGAWGPVNGVMIHHTVTKGHDNTIEICRTGYSTLPGPLCHGVICKKGEVHVVGYGRANHAGLGDDDVLQAVTDEKPIPPDDESNTDGNAHFYGFECENLGDGTDPWPKEQVEAIVRVGAALCRAHGWNVNGEGSESVIGHKEWQPGKVDPRGIEGDMAAVRARTEDRLQHAAGWSVGDPEKPTTPAPTPPSKPPVEKVYGPIDLSNSERAFQRPPRNPASGSVTAIQYCLKKEGLYTGALDGAVGKYTKGAYKAWQKRCGYSGQGADGIPGDKSLSKLAKKYKIKYNA
jgi:hypothetical protein